MSYGAAVRCYYAKLACVSNATVNGNEEDTYLKLFSGPFSLC